MSLLPKVFIASSIIYWEITKALEVWLLSMRSVPKSAFCLMQKLSKCVRHAKEKRRKRKERPFGQCVWQRETNLREELKHKVQFGHFCVWVPERAKHKKEGASAERCSLKNREKHSESVREWKRKMRHFSLLKLHTRKINWWSSHGVFECYNHGELESSEEDFATGFVMRLYLLLEIYLLYIQFIVDSSLA